MRRQQGHRLASQALPPAAPPLRRRSRTPILRRRAPLQAFAAHAAWPQRAEHQLYGITVVQAAAGSRAGQRPPQERLRKGLPPGPLIAASSLFCCLGGHTALGPIQARRGKTLRLQTRGAGDFGRQWGAREESRSERGERGIRTGVTQVRRQPRLRLPHLCTWSTGAPPRAPPPCRLRSSRASTPRTPPAQRRRRRRRVRRCGGCGASRTPSTSCRGPAAARARTSAAVTHALRLIRSPHFAKQSQLKAWPGMAASLTRACMTPTETRGAQRLRRRSLVYERPRPNYLFKDSCLAPTRQA